jgi:predicted permease
MPKLRRFFNRARRDRELREELQAFVDELTARNISRGMPPSAARRAALVEAGGVQQVRELTREQWVGTAAETLLRDVRYGFRSIARAPGFALVVVATLALVIGANATVFSVMHAVLWRPLPYPGGDRLVVLDADARGQANVGIAFAEIIDLRAEAHLFDGIAYIVGVDAHVNVNGDMERVPAVSASDDALHLLGAVPMALGRPLKESLDGGLNTTIRRIVISDALWERRLGRDPNVIGRHIEVNNIDAEIVGVLRSDFRLFLPAGVYAPEVVDVWFPIGFDNDRRNRGPITIARLATGVTLDAAQTRLEALADRFVHDYPRDYAGGGLRLFVQPVQSALTADVARALWVLAGAVAFVLLIGCVNVGNLMLARARARDKEMALRRALGAGTLRLMRQYFTEAAVLSLVAAAAGFVLAYGGVALVEWLRPAHLPRQSTIHVTAEVAAFTAFLAVVVSIVFAVVPVLWTRRHSHDALRAGRVAAHGTGMRRTQRTLVVAEIALSIVPLVAAGLMVRSFANLVNSPLGFEPHGIVSAKVPYNLRAYPQPADKWRLYQSVLDRVRQIPGVEDVSAGGPVPLTEWQLTRAYARQGDAMGDSHAAITSVLPGYLRVSGTRLRAGREFTADDIEQQRSVVIIDERIAKQLWPDGAIGKQLAYQRGTSSTPLEVIGVSEPVRVTRVRDDTLPHLFIPFHLFTVEQALVIKTSESAAAIGPVVKETVEALGTRRPVYDIRPMPSYVDASMGDTRFLMLILTGFALTSILLAAVGLYGTLSYLTSQRTQEFGIRVALGASASRVLGAVAREGLWLSLMGSAIGFAGAAATTGALRGLLYNVTPFDGVTLLATAAAVAATALIASTHPAWRAAKVDPTTALRAE